jgi:hypothetical protein
MFTGHLRVLDGYSDKVDPFRLQFDFTGSEDLFNYVLTIACYENSTDRENLRTIYFEIQIRAL